MRQGLNEFGEGESHLEGERTITEGEKAWIKPKSQVRTFC